MTEKTFFQLRQLAQSRGIPAAAKLRKADLKQLLDVEGAGLPGSVLGMLRPEVN